MSTRLARHYHQNNSQAAMTVTKSEVCSLLFYEQSIIETAYLITQDFKTTDFLYAVH
jgi:hypothetical protein